MNGITGGFIVAFLQSFLTNLWVAAAALIIGTMAGAPLAWLRHRFGFLGGAAAALTGLLRAAPTFVVMFFLLNVLPADMTVLGLRFAIAPAAILVLALAIYAAAYVSDNLLDALRHLDRKSMEGALLFVPNMLRAFIVLVMASSVGAAIGVREAVTTTLRQADRLPSPGGRIGLVIVVILFFACVMMLARIATLSLSRILLRRYRAASGQTAAEPARARTLLDVLLLTTSHGWVLAVALALVALVGFVVPLPPQMVTIETGPVSGSWYQTAEKYRDYLEARGIRVRLRPRDATFTILHDVDQADSTGDAGFVIHKADPRGVPNVTTLGGIEYQPLFAFHRRALGVLPGVAALRGTRVAFPPRASATADAALPILRAFGVTEDNSTFTFQPLADQLARLNAGLADVVFIMLRADHPLIGELMRRDDLTPMDFRQAAAIAHHFPTMHAVVVPAGTYDLAANLPPADLSLAAGVSQFVVKKDLHPGIVYLLLEAMTEAHRAGSAVSREAEFPAPRNTALPLNEAARQYYRHGLPWVYKELPLWLASVLGYYMFLIVPIAVLAPFHRWLGLRQLNEMMTAMRLALWLRTLRDVEERLAQGLPVSRARLATVRRIRAAIDKTDHQGALRKAMERLEHRLPSKPPAHPAAHPAAVRRQPAG